MSTREYEEPSDEQIREVLRALPGWYALLRTPRGYERAPLELSDNLEIQHDQESGSTTIIVKDVAKMEVRRDQLVLGLPIQVGVYHPKLRPDPLDRGEPCTEDEPWPSL